MANLRKRGITFLKIVISGILIYFIFTKIQLQQVLDVLSSTRPGFLVAAIALFVLSKLLAAFRLNLYFHKIRAFLSQKNNLMLYLQGMFYNLFLPGGIGGDAYKGYMIRQLFKVKTKRIIAVLVLDRLSGLLLLFLYSCFLLLFMDMPQLAAYKYLFAVAGVLSIVIFRILNVKLFPYVLMIFWRSFAFSSLVQAAQLCCLFFILRALQIDTHLLPYMLIFLLSSIVAVLPLTLGGIGSRELVFYYGALWLGLDDLTAVSISMVFFMITAFVSLFGIVFHFKKPQLNAPAIQ